VPDVSLELEDDDDDGGAFFFRESRTIEGYSSQI
jgi:hypothetical protein